MADTHCFKGTREIGKPKLRSTSSASSSTSNGVRKSPPQRLSDILRMRRLRLNRTKTANTSSISDSMSESANNTRRSAAVRTNSSSLMSTSSDLCRNNSTHSYQSARSTRSNMTAMTTLSSASSTSRRSDKSRRLSKYDDEASDGQLGINEKELNSMNKHIPALRSHGKSATFRQHYYPEGGWGWVVTFCCFVVNMFTTGLQLSFSVLYLEILRHCGAEVRDDKISVVWIGSTNLAVSHLLAPFLVALCRRKSARLTAVVGGLVLALSLLFASFAKQYNQVFFSYGIFCGIGCAMVRETSSLMLGQYFKRKRELVETLSATGIGFGIAIFSNVYHLGLKSLGWRLGLQAMTGSAISLFFLGLFYRSASLYHPQRRAILHLKDMSKRKGKDKNKIECKPPYFDASALRMRSFQVVLAAVAVAYLGIYAPLFFLVPLAMDEGLGEDAILLQTFLGVASSIGAFSFGIVILSKSQQCMISRQYLLQASIFGIGISILALASVEGYHGYLLFVWMYGVFIGGAEVSFRVYCYEKLRIKHYSRGWGYIQGAKAFPYLVGFPITAYICEAAGDPKAGFYFSFVCCILGATLLFFMDCSKSSSVYGSRLDLCKTDTNLTMFEMNGSVVQDPASGGGPSAADKIGLIAEPRNGHLKCTCLPVGSVGLEELEDKIKEMEEASLALAEVSMASNNSKVHFNEEIQVVPEDEEENDNEEAMIDLAQALYAAGAQPELLECISEEDLYREALKNLLCCDGDPAASSNDRMFHSAAFMPSTTSMSPEPGQKVRRSQSETDLVHLLGASNPVPLSSSATATAAAATDPNQSAQVRRQKTWHQFKPILAEAVGRASQHATSVV